MNRTTTQEVKMLDELTYWDGPDAWDAAEDSNGLRRDTDGRALPCACAEHGEECGQCMKRAPITGDPARQTTPGRVPGVTGQIR